MKNIFGATIWYHIAEEKPETQRLVEDLGAGYVFVGNMGRWRFLEPIKGDYRWRLPDDAYNWATSRGLETAAYLYDTPKWASTRPDAENYNQYPPVDMNDYKNIVNLFVKRYNPKIVILWPEPHVTFVGTHQEYVNLIKAGYEGAKAANPECKVLAEYGYSIRHIYDSKYPLDSLVKLGMLDYADGLACSTYTGNIRPEERLPMWLKDLRDYLTGIGKGDLPLYAKEWGYSIAPPDVETPAGGHWTKEEQAENTKKACEILFNDPYVKLISYWNMYASGNGVYYSLLETDRVTPRPVYHAYRDLIAALPTPIPPFVDILGPAAVIGGAAGLGALIGYVLSLIF